MAILVVDRQIIRASAAVVHDESTKHTTQQIHNPHIAASPDRSRISSRVTRIYKTPPSNHTHQTLICTQPVYIHSSWSHSVIPFHSEITIATRSLKHDHEPCHTCIRGGRRCHRQLGAQLRCELHLVECVPQQVDGHVQVPELPGPRLHLRFQDTNVDGCGGMIRYIWGLGLRPCD